jgi:hypothetical protein
MRCHDSSLPGFLRSKSNARGEQCSYYRLDVPVGYRTSDNGKGRPEPVEPADEDTRHEAYAALCEVLGLSAAHHAALLDRGLSDEDITRGQYASLPAGDRGKIAFAVLGLVKANGIRTSDLVKVPGFARHQSTALTVFGRPGVLIPVMSRDGTIGGMMLRPDHPALDPKSGKPLAKYQWLTSAGRGARAVASAHIPPGVSPPTETIRLTEGPLKAAIAMSKTGLPTIGLPGAGSWRLALPALDALGARSVRLAFDMDIGTNPNVAGALARATRGMVAAGLAVAVERWEGPHKGIDDALVAGAAIELLDGLDAVQFALDAVRRHGLPAHVEPGEVLAWVTWHLDREPKGLFDDAELVAAMVRLRYNDPIAFAAVETRLRSRKLWNVFSGWVKHRQAQQKQARPAATPSDVPYVERDGCTFAIFVDRDNLDERKIAGFTARIAREITRHEAGETHKYFEVKATHRDGTAAAATIKAGDFEGMQWVPSELGSKFAVEPGRGTRDLMRHAVQVLSHRDKVEHLEVFTSLGWQEVGDAMIYLHAGGGIGAAGPVAVHVETEPALAVYQLPAPDLDKLRQAVEHVFLMPARLGSKAVAAVNMSLPYRAVLGPARFVVHYSGTSGSYKTSCTCLVLRFFAPAVEYDAKMPASWEATVYGIERLQHQAGDTVLVVDDLVADGDNASRELYKADVVFSRQGDLTARRRMRSDGTLAPALDPRTSLISSGECDPRRRSALGRSLIVEFEKGTIALDGLKECHAAARAGHYARTIACYVQHLAAPGRLEAQRQALRRLALDYQTAAIKHCPDCHPRQAESVAELVAAWRLFLAFAVEVGALASDRAETYVEEVRENLFELLAVQAAIQEESDPGEIFLELVRSLLASKRAVLFATDGTMPPVEIAGACGWENATITTHTGSYRDWIPAPGAARIGWVDGTHVYLDPNAAHAAAERLAHETHQVLGTQRQVLSRLAETRRISTDPCTPGERRRFTQRQVIEKSRRRVVHMIRDEVLDLETAETAAAPSGTEQTPQTNSGVPF